MGFPSAQSVGTFISGVLLDGESLSFSFSLTSVLSQFSRFAVPAEGNSGPAAFWNVPDPADSPRQQSVTLFLHSVSRLHVSDGFIKESDVCPDEFGVQRMWGVVAF